MDQVLRPSSPEILDKTVGKSVHARPGLFAGTPQAENSIKFYKQSPNSSYVSQLLSGDEVNSGMG